MLRKIILSSLLVAMSAFAAEEDKKIEKISEEEVIDPSNAAKPMSMLSFGATQYAKDANGGAGGTGLNAMGMVAGKMSADAMYAVLLEVRATPDMTLDYYRGRWFNVFATGDDVVSNVGYSLDYFGNDTMNSFSLGSVLQFETGVPFVRLFWNAAYNYSQQTVKLGATSVDENVNGLYTNFFFNFILSEDRTYFMFIPEYQYNKSANLESNGVRLTGTIGAPLTTSKQLWLAASYIYQSGHMSYNLANQPGATNPYANIDTANSYVNFNLSYYFR